MPDALDSIADDRSDTGLEEIERRSHPRRSGLSTRWALPPNIERAAAAREKKPPAPVPAMTIAPPAVETPQPADVVLIKGNTRVFEPFRIVEDYEALCEAFSERVEDLQATRLGIDAAGRFAGGHASTLLCNPQIKGYGPTSLTRMLKATGLVIVLAIDDEKFAKVKDRLILRERQLRPAAHKPTAPQ
jgi:hypothetical protein